MCSPPRLVHARDEPNEAFGQPRPLPVLGDLFLACANGAKPMFGSVSEQTQVPNAYSEGLLMSMLQCGSTMPASDYKPHVASVLSLSGLPAPSFGRSNEKSGLVGSVELGPEAKDRSAQRGKHNEDSNGPNSRWWARLAPGAPHLCPLNNFPICLLPYPPFKLRMDPKYANPHHLVDGKSLAMQVCICRNIKVCGRKLSASDLAALDDYVQRCRLGPFRPQKAASLRMAIHAAPDKEARQRASKVHECFVNAARLELDILRTIQEHRLQNNSAKSEQHQEMEASPTT